MSRYEYAHKSELLSFETLSSNLGSSELEAGKANSAGRPSCANHVICASWHLDLEYISVIYLHLEFLSGYFLVSRRV